MHVFDKEVDVHGGEVLHFFVIEPHRGDEVGNGIFGGIALQRAGLVKDLRVFAERFLVHALVEIERAHDEVYHGDDGYHAHGNGKPERPVCLYGLFEQRFAKHFFSLL